MSTDVYSVGAPDEGNAYRQWIKDNADYTPTRLNNILDAQQQELDVDLASEIYREGVMHEIEMFNWSTSKEIESNRVTRMGFRTMPS